MTNSTSVVTDIQQVTPAWLTIRLQGAGVLPQGEVVRIVPRANDAFNSVVVHLKVTYSSDAPDSVPRTLLLKRNRNHDGALEHHFYQSLHGLQPGTLPIVPCFETAYSPETGYSLCLLEDLSSTHHAPVTRQQLLALQGVPRMWQLKQIADSIAQIHAYWWQHPKIGSDDTFFAIRPWFRDENYFQRHIERRWKEWKIFSSQKGNDLSDRTLTLYKNVLNYLPRLWECHLAPRIENNQHLTVTQGDCYITQFLCPKIGPTGRTYLVDFDSASANFGAYDLVYLIPTFWTRQQRYEQNREEQVLRWYHQALQTHGVKDYSWEMLLADYKLMLTFMIFDPVWDQTYGASPTYWKPKLQCLTDAYLDLDCAALLET